MITRMKAERLRRGWNQTQLAAKSGLSGADVSRIESGRTKPYPVQAARLSKVLKMETGKLLELVKDTRPGYADL